MATCAFGFALLLWNTLATPRYWGGLGIDSAEGPSPYTVTHVEPGWPAARAGLRVGDKVDFLRGKTQGVTTRKLIVGRPFPVRVERGARVFYLSLIPVAHALTLDFWLNNLTTWWFTLFATIVAWFGVGRRARLLAWLLILGAIQECYFVSPWPWLNEAASLLNAPVGAVAIALLATISSTFGRPISLLRRTLELSTYALAVIGVAVIGIFFELTFLTSWFDRFWSFVNIDNLYWLGPIIASLLAAVCAFMALATVRGEERQRAAWLLGPLGALYLVNVLWFVAIPFTGGFYAGAAAQQALDIVQELATFILAGIMTYAVLRRRLLDVEFVINRAAVFAGVSLVVVGTFVLAEFLFNRFFTVASRTTSILVSVGVALVVGVSLQYIHRYVDKLVDLLFFRTRHEHEQSLRAFAHEAAFITDSDTLLNNAVREVSLHAESDPVSILLRDDQGNYTTARSTNGTSDSVSENDRAILKLRAWHSPIDLDDTDTALAGSRAYPLISRGDLLGVLVCGEKRDGQPYAPDESEALFVLARGVGSALDGLHRERRDDLKAAIDELKRGMVEIRDTLRDLTPSGDGNLPKYPV